MRTVRGVGAMAGSLAAVVLLVAGSARGVDTEVLFDGLNSTDWSTCRDPARIERELALSELTLLADPPALRWRFVSKTVSFNDLFLLRPIERRFDTIRARVRNRGEAFRLAAKVRDASGAEWTTAGTELPRESEEQWVDFPWPSWHIASWSNDADGKLDFPLVSLTLIAFGIAPGPEYSVDVQRIEILRPDRPQAILHEFLLPGTLQAGKPFAVTLAFSLSQPLQEEDAYLVFRRGGRAVARLPLPLPVALGAVEPGVVSRIDKATLCLSQYAWSGVHDVSVQLGEARVQRPGQSTEEGVPVKVMARECGRTVATVKVHGGTPTLFIDGRPRAGMTWATYRPTVEVFSDFAQAGVDLFTFSGTPTEAGYGLSKTVWTAPDVFDYSQFDERVAMVLQACPTGYIFPRLYLHAPAWWSAEHPDDIVLMDPGDGKPVPFIHSGGKPAPSWASDTWRRDTIAALKRLVEHVESSPYADRIIGYHLASGTTEEWMMWGSNEGEWVDYSPANLAKFRTWLQSTYRTDAALQAAWHNPGVTLTTAPLPTRARRQNSEHGSLRNPATEQDVIDFYLYNSDLVAETICTLAQALKEITGREKIVGVFYGYLLQLCGEQRQQNSGHLALDRVLASPDVDFLCSPTSYAFRQVGGEGTCHFMSLFDSVKLHGKLWFDENDVRTSISGGKPGEWGRPTDVAGDLVQQDKELANCIANGAAQWWFDVGSNRYDNPAIMERIRQWTHCANAALDSDRSPVDEVAFVVDEKSLCSLRVGDRLGSWLLLGQLPALQRLGAPIGHYLTDDLPRLKDHKLFLFPTSLAPTAAQRQAIDALKGGGRVLVFLWGAGAYRDGQLDEQGMADLTGIRLRQAPQPGVLSTTLLPGLALSEGLGGRTYGPADTVTTWFYAEDADAVVLGTLADGRPGLVVRQFPDWTAVYSAAPLLPAALLRHVAQQAGVHLYIDTEDVVWASRDLLAVSVRNAGPRTIQLPRKAAVTHVFSGEKVNVSGRSFTATFSDRQTLLWRLH